MKRRKKIIKKKNSVILATGDFIFIIKINLNEGNKMLSKTFWFIDAITELLMIYSFCRYWIVIRYFSVLVKTQNVPISYVGWLLYYYILWWIVFFLAIESFIIDGIISCSQLRFHCVLFMNRINLKSQFWAHLISDPCV